MPPIIKCPECGYSKDLVIVLEGEASMRIPVKDGILTTSEEYLLDAKVPGITTISVSSLGGSRIVLYPQMEVTLHCPKCNKAFDSVLGTECNAAE